MKRASMFLGLLALSSCAAPRSDALSAIADEGLTEPELGGAAVIFNGCSDDQNFSRTFTARRGDRRVEGVVCCSLFSCSVRYTP